MTNDNFTIRRMNRDEIDMAIDWAAIEGWNPGIHDAECFFGADPNGFFLGLIDDKPIAMVSAVSYGKAYGFMGFYIVKPEYRNKGYGLQLADAGLKYLGNRTIGLDSVRPDLVSHKKPEFKAACVNFRFKWTKDRQSNLDPEIMSLTDVPWPTITTYDHKVFTFKRESFLKCWITRPNTLAVGIVIDRQLLGYGVIRECRDGFKIGPLFAENKDLAKSLFNALTSYLETGTTVFLDTPQVNEDSVKMAEEYRMTEVFRTTRMYNGKGPTLPLQKWFGVTSFELG
jgi:hypothetical protein